MIVNNIINSLLIDGWNERFNEVKTVSDERSNFIFLLKSKDNFIRREDPIDLYSKFKFLERKVTLSIVG